MSNHYDSWPSVTCTTTSGYSWTTSIRGPEEKVNKYFLNQRVDIGIYPEERMEEVIKVEYFAPLFQE